MATTSTAGRRCRAARPSRLWAKGVKERHASRLLTLPTWLAHKQAWLTYPARPNTQVPGRTLAQPCCGEDAGS